MNSFLSEKYLNRFAYYYKISDKLDNNQINQIILQLMKKLNFRTFSFKDLDQIQIHQLILPKFFISNDEKDLFLVKFCKEKNIIELDLYSSQQIDYSDTLKSIANELSLSEISFSEVFSDLDSKYLKFFKQYHVDTSKIDFDKNFLDQKFLKVCYQVITRKYSELSLEDLSYLENLEKNDFIKIHIVFKCQVSGSSIFQLNKLINSQTLIEGFRCPICGKKLSEEKKEINLTISPQFEFYFNNHIWLRNIIFDYLKNRLGITIYEYDKDVYLVKYLSTMFIFVFGNCENFDDYLLFYKEAEILNVEYSFFFCLNFENKAFSYPIVGKSNHKFDILHIDQHLLAPEHFNDILERIKQKMERIYTIRKLTTTTIILDYEKFLPYPKSEIKQAEYIQNEILHDEAVQNEPIQAEPVQTEPIQTEPIQTEPVQTEPIQTEPVQTEPVQTESMQDQSEQIQQIQQEEETLELENIQNEITQLFDNMFYGQELQQIYETQSTHELKEEIKKEEYLQQEEKQIVQTEIEQVQREQIDKHTIHEVSLDDLLTQVKASFKNELENDINYQELKNVFDNLTDLIQKRGTNFIENNLLFFENNIKRQLSFIDYYVVSIKDDLIEIFPKNKYSELISEYYKNVSKVICIDSVISRVKNIFCISKNQVYVSFISDYDKGLLISCFVWESTIKDSVILSYPFELKKNRMGIIGRVLQNLENFKVGGVITNFYVLNEDFELVYNESNVNTEAIYTLYKLYSYHLDFEPYVIGYFRDDCYTMIFKVGNMYVIVQKESLSYNELVEIYNSLYLLEII
ncbi:MAG: hypothetical protein ABDH21_03375 [bacterium]